MKHLAAALVALCLLCAGLPGALATRPPAAVGTMAAAAPLPASPMRGLEWHLGDTHAYAAWRQGADGHGVSVLVIDSGLDTVVATTALSGSVLPSLALPLHDQLGGLLPNPTAYVDTAGHGTFVACEIACHGLSYDYYGIAPDARIAMAKVFLGEDGSDVDVATAIRWGAIHKFPVESLSLGSAASSPALAAAVAFAEAQGTLVVAAAGNDGTDQISYPAAYPGVISVAATDRWDHLTSYSNHGQGLAIAAPGDFIFSIAPMHPTIIGCGGLCTWQGTSMATPLVAGAVADLLSAGLSTWQARQALLHGARHEAYMDPAHYGAGLLDLRGALKYARARHWIRAR